MNQETNDLIQLLLKKIQYYYPIGFPALYKDYKGQEELKEIIENKIKKIQNHEISPWNTLVKSLKSEIKDYRVQDLSFHQFPSYSLHIYLDAIELNDILKINQTIVLCLSLLVPYYTIFIESHQIISAYNERQNSNRPLRNRIIHAKPTGISGISYFNKITSFIKELIHKLYPGYEYVNYKTLFEYKIIGGFPYGMSLEFSNKQFTIYDYLFSGSMAGVDFELV